MIKAVNLVKDYGSFRAVDNIHFLADKGDILGFLGPNGAGKTTTMKMITGFLSPTSGTAYVGEYDILRNPIEAKKLIGYLPENGPLYQEMTSAEFLSFICAMRGISQNKASKALERAIEICHLEEVRDQPIETLSRGYRQRVGMAQAVLNDPPYLILDEPTDGLDPNQKREVLKMISEMASEKVIILSTHILEEVQAICNRVIIVNHGKLVVDEAPDQLLRRHERYNAVRLSFKEGGDISSISKTLEAAKSVGKVIQDNGSLVAIPKNKENLKENLWALARTEDWPLTSMEDEPAALDDVFWDLTQISKPS